MNLDEIFLEGWGMAQGAVGFCWRSGLPSIFKNFLKNSIFIVAISVVSTAKNKT